MAELSTWQRRELSKYARACILAELDGRKRTPPTDEWAQRPAATFVSLYWPDGRLQGCIGNLEPNAPLARTTRQNAELAAFHDPRNRPLTPVDAQHLKIEISLLSPLEEVSFSTEAEAVAALRPGVDGAVLVWRDHRGTFLPQVWDKLPTPERFFAGLKQKAGLPADFWHPEVHLYRYTVEKWSDPN